MMTGYPKPHAEKSDFKSCLLLLRSELVWSIGSVGVLILGVCSRFDSRVGGDVRFFHQKLWFIESRTFKCGIIDWVSDGMTLTDLLISNADLAKPFRRFRCCFEVYVL